MRASAGSVLLPLLLLAPSVARGQEPRNLLSNPSFEQVLADRPAEWNVESGAANAAFTLVEGQGHLGARCLRVTNPSPQSPHVFGRVWRNVRVQAGSTYTLSCYVKSAEPGVAWLGAGKDWQFRFPVPASAEWERVVGVFAADAAEVPVMFVTESETAEILVDDLQLELGDAATPFVFLPPPTAGEAALHLLPLGREATGENLIANSGFERAEAGLPVGWAFSARNTDSTCTLDDTVRHGGKASVRFTNGTPFGAHVYGLATYTPEIAVEPSTLYTLSAYYRTVDAGMAWIGGGPDWLVRLVAPETKGEWRRASTTFQTRADQTTFNLLASTESPTTGVWFDDVKLERGAFATPYVPEEGASEPSLILDLPKEVAADDTLALNAWLVVPERSAAARLEAELSGPGGVLARAEQPAPTGLVEVRFLYGVPVEGPEDCHYVLRLSDAAGTLLCEASTDFRLVSAAANRARITALRATAQELRTRLDALAAGGADVAYPLVSLTVLEQFVGFAEEDNQAGWTPRARTQLVELVDIATRCEAELTALETGARLPAVPRYRISPVRIADGAFRTQVTWPDGRVEDDWPLVFTGYGHFSSVVRDLPLMQGYGMNVIQIEMGPSSVVTGPDSLNTEPIDGLVRSLDRAAESGVAVCLLLSPHYMPDWVYEKWPEVGGVEGGFLRYSIDSPHTRAVLERFLRTIVPRVASHPALHSFCLSNEPIYRDATRAPENRPLYNAWLRQRHGTIEAVSAAHRATYASFDDVPVDPPPAGVTPTRQARYDYYRFNNERFAAWHRWMADVIHEMAPEVPVHAKAMNTVFSSVGQNMGVDPELFCEFSQIAGNDCWKWYSGGRNGYASEWQGENMYFDLQRSILGQPIFNTENHVIVDREKGTIPAAHIRNIIWQSAIHGEGASTTWVWERTYDERSDFAGSIMHRPECCDAHGRTGLDLLRLGPEANAFQREPARVALVYSIASLCYGLDAERILGRTYEALNFTGEKIDFLTEKQLARGDAGKYALVIAAGTTNLPEDAYRGLEQYAEAGGRVLAVGEGSLTRDDRDRPRAWGPATGLTRVDEAVARELLPALLAQLDSLPGERPVRAIDPETDGPAWGIEALTAQLDGRRLVNLTNYLPTPVRFRLEGASGAWIERFSGRPCPAEIELQPLEVMLVDDQGR